MSQRDDPFFDVPKTTFSTSEGDVELPVSYYDCSNYMAIFQAKAEKARQKLHGTGLELAQVSGKAIVALTFFKYRDTSVGPYHEVGLGILCVPEGEKAELASISALMQDARSESLGFYVLDLPVSAALANAAGREIWGYPKFVTQMPIRLDGEYLQAQVLDPDGRLILELSGQRGYGVPEETPGLDLVTYSILEGQLLRTRVQTRCQCKTSGGGSLKLVIGESQHRMANNLRDLALDNRTPKLLQTTDDFQSLLFAGEPAVMKE